PHKPVLAPPTITSLENQPARQCPAFGPAPHTFPGRFLPRPLTTGTAARGRPAPAARRPTPFPLQVGRQTASADHQPPKEPASSCPANGRSRAKSLSVPLPDHFEPANLSCNCSPPAPFP